MTLLVDLALRSSAILAVGLAARAVLRHRSAALRHSVLAGAVLASAAVVPLTLTLPSWSLTPASPVQAAEVVTDGGQVASGESVAIPTPGTARSTVGAALPVAAIVWAAGVLIGLGLLGLGIARLALIGARAEPIQNGSWTDLSDSIAADYGLRRRIAILQTSEADLLATWGLFHARVLLPAHARGWSEDRARTVLCHELAHIRRFDWIVQIGAELVRIVYWFNPLAWIACGRLRYDSEQACDDIVLGEGVPAAAYAGHLLALARLCRRPNRSWASAMLMARPSTLERRIAAMLKPGLRRERPSRRAIAVTSLFLLIVTLPIAAYRSAQTSPLPLKGVIYDATGAVLPDVEVTLIDENQAATKVTTDPAGHFEFPVITPGAYVLEASLMGFRSLRQEITLRSARDWDRAITLGVGDVRETINVQVRRPAPQTGASQARVAPRPILVGGNIRAPTKLVDVRPVYPETMREAGREGVVPIEAVIGKDGLVTSLRVVSAQVHPDFAMAALDAVRQWRFSPTLLNGQPVEVVMTVSVTFSLSD
jgi:TonB family protein